MPPKKQKTKDIRSFFNKTDSPGSSSSTNTGSAQPGEAKGSQVSSYAARSLVETATLTKVKKEDNCDSPIVATHCPCSCISDGEPLIISWESEKVEEAQGQHCQPIHSRDKYSVFYIDTVGGLFTKQKKLFRNSAVKQFKYLCVYGEKGMTVEEALRRDGRFIDDLGACTCQEQIQCQAIGKRNFRVMSLHGNKRELRTMKKKEKQGKTLVASSNFTIRGCGGKSSLDVIKQRGISVRTEVEKRGSVDDIGEIRDILRQQFPDLKELMESRFPDNSYKEALNLRKENFGKIQQSFSEVHRVKKLLKMGESVCKVIVGDVSTGTGFVLFDNFIVTNAHLFKDCVEKEKLKEGINVFAVFNYEVPEPFTNFYYFQLARFYLCSGEDELDYAILELNPEGQKPNETTQTKKMKVPPGLLKTFGRVPQNGEACIIGHPAGEVKQMDPTCIIKKERRRQAVND
ncbi:protein FAM111A-like, partial [Morone saxatilis]|uniref:protein FAM111A-like n=1 Tax=Morone saxatilis TaxID=34816 RepID=UPI0015E21380